DGLQYSRHLKDHLPPRAAGMPRSSKPAAMARSDSQPTACSSLITGASSSTRSCERRATVALPAICAFAVRRAPRSPPASRHDAWQPQEPPSCDPRSCRLHYRTVKLPSDTDVPLFVKDEFGAFYKAMFDRAVERENMQAVFVEYAWDLGWCDPCASEPLSNKELVELGARWIGSDDASPFRSFCGRANPHVTRLHLRYHRKSVPEDPNLPETKGRK